MSEAPAPAANASATRAAACPYGPQPSYEMLSSRMLSTPVVPMPDWTHLRKRLARNVSALASSTNSDRRLLIGPQSTPRPGSQLGWTTVHRSEITIDLGAIRHNVRRL